VRWVHTFDEREREFHDPGDDTLRGRDRCVRHGIRDSEGWLLVVWNTGVLVLKSLALSGNIVPNELAAFLRLVTSLRKTNVVQVCW